MKKGLPAVRACTAAISSADCSRSPLCGHDRSYRALVEAAQLDLGQDPRSPGLRQRVDERVLGVDLGVAVGDEHEKPSVFGAAHQVAQRHRAGLLSPMQVLEQQDR